ncbi:hypothetical protein EAI_12865 [Harpegnathos saltator]|uniref:Uncharacterized protein n=1 Tax=Harpegnathos saltator TaxID=610380 RepID=E2BTJ0_HARSA|nr:hypothetical protein EAI_12865 [Harpegnathos saltator]
MVVWIYLLGGFEVLEDAIDGASIHEEVILDTLHHHPKTTSFETVGHLSSPTTYQPAIRIGFYVEFESLKHESGYDLVAAPERSARQFGLLPTRFPQVHRTLMQTDALPTALI